MLYMGDEMINIAICDDEPSMVEEISMRLVGYMKEKCLTSYSVKSFASGRALLEEGGDFDLLFLDIQMEQPDGMEIARILRRQKNSCLLIFVTVLKECVFDAFEVQAYDYLLKPLREDRFCQVMDRAVKTLEQRKKSSLFIQKGNACEIVFLSQIVYCEVQGRKVYIHKNDGNIVDYYEKLESLEKRLPGRFFRCHRSYLVNLAYIRGCGGGQILLEGNGEIPVSRLRERELRQALLHYMKKKEC